MEENRRPFVRLSFFILLGSIVVGWVFNYYQKGLKKDLASPVLGGEIGKIKSTRLSPFAFLFGGSNSRGQELSAPQDSVLGLESQPSKDDFLPSTPTNSPVTAPTSGESLATNPALPSNLPGSSSPSLVLESSQQAIEDASNLVVSYLKAGNFTALYNLMSADFKSTFSQEDFVNSFSGAGKVSSGNTTSTPKVYGSSNEWAEQNISLTLADGSSQKYLNIYHWENGAWTLFATEEP